MKSPTSYIWTFLGRVGPLVIQLLAMMILARYLTPEDFGQVGVLSIFIMVATTLNDAGFGGSLIKEKEIKQIDCSTVFVYNLGVSVFLYLILFFCAGIIEDYFKNTGLSIVVRLISLVFVINSFGMVAKSLLVRQLKFKVQLKFSMTGIALASIVAIIMAVNGCGVYSLIALQLVQATIISLWALKASKLKLSIRFSINSFKRLFSFGFYTTCCNVVDTIYENSLSFLFGRYLSISQAGYITQAKKIEEISTISVAQTINTASFPILSRINKKNEFLNEAISLLRVVPLLLFPGLLILSLFSTEIVYVVLGAKWCQVAPFLSILIFAGMFMILETLVRTFIKSLGYVSSLLKVTLIKRSIGLCIILLALFTAKNQVLLAYVFGAFIGLIMNLNLFCKLTNSTIIYLLRTISLSCLPTLVIYIICLIAFNLSSLLLVKLAIAIIFLSIHYLCVLPMYGYRMRNFFKIFK